jgi:hypothetical protein
MLHVPQQRTKRYQRRQGGMGLGHRTDLGARRTVKHPRRNLQPTVRIGAGDIALKHHAVRPIDRRMNRDPKTRPGMKAIQQFLKLGPVGVLKPSCTTTSERTGR